MVIPNNYLATCTLPRLQAHRKSLELESFIVFFAAAALKLKHPQTFCFCFRLNGIAATKFERVCGNKGYSFDAFHDNAKAASIVAKGGTPETVSRGRLYNREEEAMTTIEDIGFEDCDWVSLETNFDWCKYRFYSIVFSFLTIYYPVV